jgi:hypothetical protein
MNISNEFTSPLDQGISDLTNTKIDLTTNTIPVSCASGELTKTVNINDAAAALDNQWNTGINLDTQYGFNPPSNFNTLSAQEIISTLSNSPGNVYVPNNTSSGYYSNGGGNNPPIQTTKGQYATTPNYQLEGTSSGYPTFGDNDPLFNPNRARSHNDTECNSALWSLLTIPCPTCNGGEKQALKNKAAKKYINLDSHFAHMPVAVRIALGDIEDILNGIIQATGVVELFEKKKCPTCDGKNKVKDVTGKANQNAKKTAAALNDKKEQIQKLEQKAGGVSGCGNRITIINGHDVLEVGLGMNKTKSYAQGESEVAPGSVRIGGGVEHVTTKVTVGTNPTATPGGHYTIKCSNKFTCFTGAQGIDLVTYGPVNIAGGITKITGPEVTIGSGSGTCTVEGNHLQLTGKTIGIGPVEGDNQVVVQGALGVASNLVVNGGAHVNGDLSFTSGTAPSKMARTHFSSNSDTITGKASWGGVGVFGITSAINNLVSDVMVMTMDPSTMIISVRGIQKVIEHITLLAKLCEPWELLPTGFILPGTVVSLAVNEIAFANLTGPANSAGAIEGGGFLTGGVLVGEVLAPITLNNFPHVHAMPDMAHAHDMEVPNIKLLTTSDAVVSQSRGKESAVPTNAVSEVDIIALIKNFALAAVAAAKAIQAKLAQMSGG